MKYIFSLALSVIWGANALAYNPNPYTPTGVEKNDPAALVKARGLAFSEDEAEKLKGMAALQSLSLQKDIAAKSLLSLSLAANDGTDKGLKASRDYIENCVTAHPDYNPCQIWLGLYDLSGAAADKKKPKQAFLAFERASINGSAAGQWHVGMALLKGEGVAKDEERAFALITKSARQDYIPGLMSYGTMLMLGQGASIDEKQGFKAYARAAYLGDASAMYVTAVNYENGTGIKQDRDLADAAFILAAKGGDSRAIRSVSKGIASFPEKERGPWLAYVENNEPRLIRTLKNYPPFKEF